MLGIRDFMRLLWSALVLYSCSPGLELPENYSSNQSKYQFRLNQDSTFEYSYKFEFAYQYSTGGWSKAGNRKIVLNSNIKSKVVPLREERLPGNDFEQANFFSVGVNIPNADKKYYQCMIFIDDVLYEKRSCDLLDTILVSGPMKSIFFKLSADPRLPTRFLDTLSTEKFITQSSKSNRERLAIILDDSLFNYRVFKNDTLEVARKGLRFYDPEKCQWLYVPRAKKN
jgi:hypothetical protein